MSSVHHAQPKAMLLRFCTVGVFNTLLGLGIIWSTMHWLDLPATAANAAGYAIGITVSFALNRGWTFGATTTGLEGFLRWVTVCGAGYAANLIVLALMATAGADPYVAQLPAMATYTAITFLGSKLYVFDQAAQG